MEFTISGRNLDQLASVGFGPPVLERISEGGCGFGASSFVLIAEHSTTSSSQILGQ